MNMGACTVVIMRKGTKRRPGATGIALARIRGQVGMSQRQLAEASGVHFTTIANLERGTQEGADLKTVERLAKALGVSVADLAETSGVAAIEPLIQAFLQSDWGRVTKAEDDELDWLRALPGIFWRGIRPEPEALHLIIMAHRKGRPPKP